MDGTGLGVDVTAGVAIGSGEAMGVVRAHAAIDTAAATRVKTMVSIRRVITSPSLARVRSKRTGP